MEDNSIQTIASLLPDEILYDAACGYVLKLARSGNLEKAEDLYEKLFRQATNLEKLAEAARGLVTCHLKRREMEQAIKIYECFQDRVKPCSALGERLKSLHVLVFALIPDHFTKACELWREYAGCDLDSCLKWQWVESGLALLEFCHKNSFPEVEEIYRLIKKNGHCESTRNSMARADKLMAKPLTGPVSRTDGY